MPHLNHFSREKGGRGRLLHVAIFVSVLLATVVAWTRMFSSRSANPTTKVKSNDEISTQHHDTEPLSFSAVSFSLPTSTASLRVVGPHVFDEILINDNLSSFASFTQAQQQSYLQQYGQQCHDGIIAKQFVQLTPLYQTELFKHCILHLGHANVYMEAQNVVALQELQPMLQNKPFIAIQMQDQELMHGAFVKTKEGSSVCLEMIKNIVSIKQQQQQQQQQQDAFLLQKWLYAAVLKSNDGWTIWSGHCRDLAGGHFQSVTLQIPQQAASVEQRLLNYVESGGKSTTKIVQQQLSSTHSKSASCPVVGGYCCHVLDQQNQAALLLRHPGNVVDSEESIITENNDNSNNMHPYMATIHQEFTNQSPKAQPNLFDILLQNDCLDATLICHKCLKSTKTGSCDVCKEACPCFCSALCKIRPPPKPITSVYHVTPPLFKKDAHRLVPRIVHQTWYEPVTPDKYPNMSRLIESWKQSGWEYNFYDDHMAAAFLSDHFPPEVREAYDAILPGAFKADLFRYCVLLIRGGVYADMDVLLESNLDEAVANDVGFMTPIDEPGIKVGHRSCLWNGLLAVAPGHVFLAKTIEMVVNNIRNRFTSVDYDDMLCPNPALSVSHTVDTLFTCGPCILGAAINSVLGRHMQDEFEIGDVDLYKSSSGKVHPDDPRLLIPGRTVILKQNKADMGAHRFTYESKSLIVAATDMPDYDDRPPDKEHYSTAHLKVGVYGLTKLYKNSKRANEEIRIIVKPT